MYQRECSKIDEAKLIELKDEREKLTIDRDFKTSLSVIDKPTRQKISKYKKNLNNIINQLYLINIY